ncbi:non-ribosomal peptide synthase protein (TIGR01720 family)/amino acid adenylation domain-containing protein [Chitinophaga niastensis]|uniref:Non-ribosomal peptide synthase protein (TIGR01720 family)/amino acid adenylation domain-containing protein n=1 Tax=Chitinophaga niastensis TaxID=536980 RepID=A0A2P8HHD2_CHINA|nr:non-ribosomal peptide synthetase [Chitinophaga niastensis]PSL45611.1 non-ribosomal peptide synthase protein (TIGR01720 family)/amino acid adenylation domain-containing protein [Chitinophaga niastensis]
MTGFNLIDIVDLLEKANDIGIQISFDDNELIVQTHKENIIDASFLNELKSNKEYLIEYFKKHHQSGSDIMLTEEINTAGRNGSTRIPLSFSQERLWFIDQLEGSVQYHLPVVLRVKGALNKKALVYALQHIINRHEVLRTVIAAEGGKAWQQIQEKDQWQLELIDEPIYKEVPTALQSCVKALIAAPFDLSKDHMLRAHLIVQHADEHVLVVIVHHIASDGWSTGIIIRELVELYGAYAEDRTAQLPVLDLQYADYAIWQREYLSGEVLTQQLDYWKNKLSGVDALSLVTDHPRPAIQSTRGATRSFRLPRELTAQLHALSRQEDTTLFMTLLAAFNVLLYRYSAQDDICVGSPIAGRTRQELEGLIGFFINTLVLRNDLSNNPSFTNLMQQVKETTLSAYDHQEIPFEKIVEAVVKQRDLSRNPLFQVVFMLQNTPEEPDLSLDAVSFSHEQVVSTTTMFDLIFSVEDRGGELTGSVSYCIDLFDAATIDRMITHFEQLLLSIVASPASPIASFTMLAAREEEQLILSFNDTTIDYPQHKTIIEQISLQAALTPAATALVFDDRLLTYRELEERSGQLAHYLISKGITTETVVPVCMERSPEIVVSMLGIMKAGGAYVPVDPEYPTDRIRHIIADTRAAIIVGSKACVDKLKLAGAADIITLDGDKDIISQYPATVPNLTYTGHQLAYVIYTSGSTGLPKGVMIEHNGVANLVNWHNATYGVTAASKATAAAGMGFDAFGWEVWPYLCKGAAVNILNDEKRFSLTAIVNLFREEEISHGFLSTALLHEFIREAGNKLTALKYLLTGGDKLTAIDVSGLTYKVVNNYGPTENSVVTTYYPLSARDKDVTPVIGRPVSNTKIYIINSHTQLSPVGVPGEICIAGKGVSRGYLNRPELTAEKFIANPFDVQGGNLYRTGDLGRWQPDGNIEYLGRIDDQVKIRGYRIELGEIENVLQQCNLVKQAVVLAKEDHSGHRNKRLVGYIVPANLFDKEGIIAFLKQQLPDYMIPALLIPLEKLPLTANGKIDKKALPDTDAEALLTNAYVAPRNATEQGLATIWQELLGVSRVGIHDNFFELGGDSIITIQVVSRAKRAGYELQPRDLFLHQTIAALAVLLSSRKSTATAGEQGLLTGHSGLLPIQQWYFNTGAAVTVPFNQSVLLSIDKSVDTSALDAAISGLVDYHDALRFVYTPSNNGWQQLYGSAEGRLEIADLQAVSPDNLANGVAEQANHYQQSLQIEKGILIRAVLLLTPASESRNRLLIVVHHLAVDGVSWRILLEDLELLLKNDPHKNAVDILGRKSSSYRQWFTALANYGQRHRVLTQEDYWKRVVAGYVPLQTDKIYKGQLTVSDTGSHTLRLGTLQTQRLLQEVPRAYHTAINDVLLCALALTVSAWNKSSKVVIGMEGHGREDIAKDIDTSRTIGWFTNMYPVLLEVAAGSGPQASLKAVKEQLRQVPDKGLGYGILKYIQQAPDLQGKDPWDIVFNYLGQSDNTVKQDGYLGMAPESSGTDTGTDFPMQHKLAVTGMVQGAELILQWEYSNKHYAAAGIEKLATAYLSNLTLLIDHCVEQATQATIYTPSDYGLGTEVSNEELDEFLDADYKGAPRRSQVTGLYRLSGLQEGMLFHSLYDAAGSTYVEQFSCDLSGLQEDFFRQSWDHLLQQHSILRSGFYHDVFPVPVQCVYREVNMPVHVLDYRHMAEGEQAQAVKDYEAADSQKGFDLKEAPLMRISLLRLKDDTYRMLWTSHHILYDGWSLPVMIEELLNTYESLATGKPVVASAEDRFEDYIRYQERLDKEQEEQYWRGYLKGLEKGSLLPFIGATAKLTKGGGNFKERIFKLDTATTAHLTHFAQQHHITQNTLMQGVWAYLLYRYSGHKDVAYGITVSGRPEDLPGVEQRVGLYINTLPLYTVVDPSLEIVSWLQALQTSQLMSREYQYTGLNEIQRWTNIPGELFDSTITFQNYPINEVVDAKTWQLQVSDVETHPHTNYPLTIIMGITAETTLIFTYNNDLLSDYFIEKIAGHFEQVIGQIINRQAEKIGEIALLTSAERQELKVAFNNNITAPSKEQSFVDLFETQAALTPQATALVFEEELLTYQELDERSGRLANYLRSKGVIANTLVPLCIERSTDMIVGILGILKAGGAYVPIEPDFPAERIKYMLEDTHATVIVSSSACRELLPVTAAMQVVALDDDSHAINKCSPIAPAIHPVPDQLLYVIYTSGSTGTPKGVMVTHGNLADYVAGLQVKLDINSCRSFGLLSSIATDLGNTVLYSSLVAGAALHLFSKAAINDAEALYTYFERYPIDCIKIVPSHWKALSAPGRLLLPQKLLVFGGEALGVAVVDSIRDSNAACTVVNHYGPTETTIGKLLHVVDPAGIYEQVIPIGKPFSNTRIYVLNQEGQPCPVGVPGELYIGGDGVALGYLNNPELTASRFITDPFSTADQTKLYRTGDLVKCRPDGNIVFLGRVDDQVKIRGYRVEPGEISRVLSGCEQVSQAVVIAREDSSGNKRLIGYIIPAANFDKEAVITYLREQLPEHMIPAVLVVIDYFPLLPNGKIDRKSLPDPEVNTTAVSDYTAPETDIEKKLAAIWSLLLEVDEISVHDDFFALGGHSLLAIRVISAIRKQLGVEVAIGDVFDYPTIFSLSQQLSQRSAPTTVPALVRGERPARIPLSYSQERLWFIDQLEGSLHYHIPTVLQLKGRLNQAALSHALQTIVNRHESLRTVIAQQEGIAYQRILNKDQWKLGVTHHPEFRENKTALQHYIQQLVETPFDLTNDHMLRVDVIVLEEEVSVLVATVHHIASDGWSTGILVRELVALYNAFESGSHADLPALDIQYADYAIWQRNYLSGKVLEEKIAYWKDKLTGVPALNLPADYPRPAVQSTRGAISLFQLDPALSASLQALSQQQGSTLFMTLLAAFKVLLYRYSGQEDICVGSSIAGRTQQETEGLIGFFINTLALRSDLSNAPSFIQLLQQVRETTLKAYGHQDVPFEKVVEAVVKERDISRTPLFQVMFELQNVPDAPEFRLGEVLFEAAGTNHVAAKFDMNISLQESAAGLSGYVEYCVDLFNEETIARLLENYEQLLWSVVKDPAASIATLPMLTAAAQQQLLVAFNDTEVPYPADKTLVELFTLQAARTPAAVALKFGNQELAYHELEAKANTLAGFLRSKGVKEDTLVPICIERSLEMVVGILGILKAGGAYVPIDPEYPAERIQYMLEDCNATVVVSSSYAKQKITATIPVIALDTEWDSMRVAASSPQPAPHHLAYVIYTSGSTGKPKGVMVEHRGMLNHLYAKISDLKMDDKTILAYTAAYTFDISVWQMFSALLCGGTTIIYPDELILQPGAFISQVEQDQVTILELVPSYLSALLQENTNVTLKALQFLLVTGEVVSQYVLKQWFEHAYFGAVPVVNAYGPTEASDDICHYFMYNVPASTNIPLGTPIQNLHIHILDGAQQLCPIGVPGEICVSGIGVARGYLNRPDLTAAKFIKDPFSAEEERMYKTGDLGRWLQDGNIEYLGRIDEQVKIHGYRIELGEIESVLQQCEGVSQAVVLAKSENKEPHSNKRLIGYIVPEGDFDKGAVLSWLKGKLPEYMVPSLLIELEQLPLTANGKIDKKALPDLDAALLVNEYTAPRNEMEQALACIWQELLGVQRVGIYDNFFELGGHSLMVMRLVAAVGKRLSVALPVKAIFTHPVIATLATYLEAEKNNGVLLPVIEKQTRPVHIPLSFNQERLWFVDQLEGSIHYHIPIVLRLKGLLDKEALATALNNIVSRHEVLRTVIEQEDGKPYQRIRSAADFELSVTDNPVYKDDQHALHQQIAALVSAPFDLSADYMLRAHLIKLATDEHVLVIITHHVASDGLSTGIMAREFIEGYNACLAGTLHQQEPLKLQYADYAIWQRSYLAGETLDKKLAYWKDKLTDVPPLNLPTDFKQPAIQSMRGGRVSTVANEGVLVQLQQLSQQQGTTLYMTLLAAFKVLLYRYSGQTDIVVGSSSAGRQQQDIEALIGFFINMLTLRSDISDNPSFIALLQQVKQTTLDAFEHQDVPFEKIVEAVVKDREHGRRPLFQVMFVMPDKAGSNNAPGLKGITLSPEIISHSTARYNLLFSVQETSVGLNIDVEYSKDLFREDTVVRMMEHFKQLLAAIAASPATPVDLLPLQSENEYKALLQAFGKVEVPYSRNQTFVDWFAIQAARTPAATALVFEDKQLTYKELDERSNQLAHYLHRKGVQANSLVPLCIARSLDMMVGILGILKAGAAYVPIEPDFPAERIQYMLSDTHATIIVSNDNSREVLPEGDAIQIISLDEEAIVACDRAAPGTIPAAEQLAYVIYTSGSTGTPKGVMITHHNLADYLAGLQAHIPVAGCRSFGLLSSIATDLGNTVLFTALMTGGALHLFSKAAINDAAAMLTYFEQHIIDCIKIVPSHWKALSDQDRLLLPEKLLVFGGEALEAAVIENIRAAGTHCTVVNHYGPTETTIGKLLHVVDPQRIYPDVVPIGKAFSNTNIYVVSPAGQPCPVGVPGELYIGGEGVALGYLNNPELTDSKFIKNIFSPEAATKLYRTGDLVKYLPDGNIIFLGRVDDQVKIRGYRIEPGEISRVLEQCEEVSQGVVIAREDNSGNKRLIGYVIPQGTFDKTAILSYLKAQLPEYMIPATLVEMEQFPLLPNGKINKKALPDPDAADAGGEGYVAPSNPTEERLAAIWSALLEIEQVGIHDDFFALGGHSLLAIRVISAIRKQLGAEVSIGDIFDYPTISSLSQQLAGRMAPSAVPALVKQERPAHIPLSYSQERLWFIDQLEGSIHYHVPNVLHLKGSLNKAALSHALQATVNRHEVLRTVIEQEEGTPYQRILNKGQWQLTITDEQVYKENKAALQQYVRQLVDAPFDLSADHKLRAHLIILEEDEYLLVATLHHIASDGWSTGIIIRELVALYNAYVANREVQLPVLEVQYADYAIWQRNYLSGKVLEEKIAYWKDKLSGTTVLNLPLDYPRPAVQSLQGGSVTFSLDRDLCEQLQQLSRQQGTTFFMTLLAAFKTLLYRYTGQEDICIGIPIAGRTRQEIEGLLGFFINTLALRSDLSNNPSFTALLQQVKQTTLGAYEHQDVPFEKVVEAVVTERSLERSPLFQVLFSLENTPDAPDMVLDGLELLPAGVDNITAPFDLTVSLQEGATGLRGSIAYCVDLFKEATIIRLISHFEMLLRAIVNDPAQQIATLPMLPVAEEQQLLHAFNNTATDYPQQTFVTLFDAQATATPDAIAIEFEGTTLTYAALNKKANQLAHYLRSHGVREDVLVPVCLERSLNMVVAILGVLKAGGAYVPIDPAYPADRVNYMLRDTGGLLLLTDDSCKNALPAYTAAHMIILDQEHAVISGYPETALPDAPLMHHLAYVIYTSGSTGMPKGVMIAHQSLSNFLCSMKQTLHLNASCSLLAVTTFCFDIAYLELFLPLLAGGKVIVATRETAADAFLLMKQLALQQPSYMQATPATWQMLTDAGWENKEQITILAGGEAIKPELKNKLVQLSEQSVWNLYGPTEATIWATIKELKLEAPVTIGQPLGNTEIYILDKARQLAPIGVVGELCIGGVQLARGYLNRHELTAEKFIDHPFKKGERLYFTGDLGRWLPDGNVECLGRIDDQVKIRGYRIELGEIESVLQQCELVKQAVVAGKADSAGNKRLIGYIVPAGEFDREGTIAFLQSRLPEYMVPAMWVTMENLPLTANGKINKKALPEPEADVLLKTVYVAPRNATEQTLVNIFLILLKVERVGIYDDFFALGGHSLLAIRVVSAIRKQLGVEISIRTVFNHPTVAALSAQLSTQTAFAVAPALTQQERPARIPLSYSQERLWFIDQLEGSVHYHLPTVLRLKGALNQDALLHALQTIVNRHEILRTGIAQEEGQAYQQVRAKDQWQLQVITAASLQQNEAGLQDYIQQLVQAPFDLLKDDMLRVHLITLGAADHMLVVTLHHIASDGWSTGIIVHELAELYSAYLESRPAQLPALDIQYADYAIWQRNYLSGAVLEQKLAYWKNKLSGVATLDLPTDYIRPAVQSTRGAVSKFRLDQQLSDDIQTLCRQEGTTLFMTLLTAFNILLHRYSSQDDICVGTPIAGRTQQEMENLIGFFINTLALRSDLSNNPSFLSLLQQVKQTTLEAYEHQDIPFEKIVEAVVKNRDMSRSPLFQALFVLQNTPGVPDLGLGELELSAESTTHTTAKWDLTFTVGETPAGLIGSVEYGVDLFSETTINRMISHFQQLLQAIVKNPATPIGYLSMLSDGEAQQLLSAFNDNATAYPANKTIADLFELQVAATPGAIALVYGNKSYTYKTLNERADKLAYYLRSKGVRSGTLVPLCIERSLEMMVGILGILKAGGAYVPVDATYPAERINYMLADINATLLVTTTTTMELLPAEWYDKELLLLDAMGEWFATPYAGPVSRTISAKDPAYVMYTSGSTGKPKGVVVTHQNVVSLVKEVTYVTLNESDVLLSTGSPSFDATTFEYWGMLLNGGQLVLCAEDTLLNSALLKQELRARKATKMWFTSGWFNQLVDTDVSVFEDLSAILTGGEKLSEEHVRKIKQAYPKLDVIHVYGPTENTTFSLAYLISEVPIKNATPIGAPLNNRTAYVLDHLQQLVPVGIRGELYVGGSGLAAGYLNQPALTATRFIPDPFAASPGELLYKTGDLGKWLPDGNIEFLGRIDDQVKIRGFRIELGEIEHVLRQCEGVAQAVVLAKTVHSGKQLIAYIVPAGNFDREGILTYLKNKLPDYMVPAWLLEMDKLPVTANGKVDKKALLQLEAGALSVNEYVAPRSKIEHALVAIWQELLQVPQIGINDNFFELGGHSLLTIRLIAAIKKESGLEVLIRELYTWPTIAALSVMLEQQQDKEGLGRYGEGRLLLQESLPGNGHIVLLNKATQAPPLFFLPGAGGLCDAYTELGRAFNDTMAFYSFQMLGAFEDEQPADTMEAIAAQHISWIKEIQPQGPYRLAGHSFGAHVAYEITKQLEAAGEEVAIVYLLDMQAAADPDPIDIDSLYDSMLAFFEQYRLITAPYPDWTIQLKSAIAHLPYNELMPFITRFVQEQIGRENKQTAFVLRMLALSWNNTWVHNNYAVTGSVKAPAVVLKAVDNPTRKTDPYMGWLNHSAVVRTLIVPGDHLNMVDGNNAVILAGHMINQLNEK